MNYAEEKTRIENEIKRLQSELETLEKTAKKEEWKNSLVEKFKEFLENMDPETAAVEIRALRDDNAFILNLETYFYNEPESTAKVETQPEPEPKTEPEKPENKVVVCSVPKPNETPENKPVKMKMTLDEFIDSLPEPAQK